MKMLPPKKRKQRFKWKKPLFLLAALILFSLRIWWYYQVSTIFLIKITLQDSSQFVPVVVARVKYTIGIISHRLQSHPFNFSHFFRPEYLNNLLTSLERSGTITSSRSCLKS